MLLLLAPAFAADPAVSLVWKAGLGRVAVEAPAGWHVAPDAPSEIVVAAEGGPWRASVVRVGGLDGARLPVPDTAFKIEVDVSVCADGGTECRPVHLEGRSDPAARGTLALAVPAAAPSALSRGSVVKLLDFTAVWCPPCTLLAAEVLHDPADAPALAGLEVEAVDVDQPASWALKDRYAVGGYPTVIAVDAAGSEVARLVGYPGEEATLAWLAGLGTAVPLAALEAGDPTITGSAASLAARRLAEAEKPDAARTYFARAADDVDLHVARLIVDGERADAEWLLSHAPPGDWILAALDAAPDRWPAVATLVPALDPILAADVLDVLGASAGGDAGKALTAGALVVVKQALTGDPAHDRAHVTYLADLYARVGRLDEGLALLDRYATLFPAEFTYDNAACRLLLDAGRPSEAESRGRAALAKGWGDQRLRAVQPLARAIAKQGRAGEALALLDQTLAGMEAPAADVAVRTHRYLKQIQELRAELAAAR